MEKRKKFEKKKARTGFEPAIFVSSNPVTIEMTPPPPESSSNKLQVLGLDSSILSSTHNANMFVVQIRYQNQNYQNFHWSRA